jgi:hypothetical protein
METIRYEGKGSVPVRVHVRHQVVVKNNVYAPIYAVYMSQTDIREVRISKWLGEEHLPKLEALAASVAKLVTEVNNLS